MSEIFPRATFKPNKLYIYKLYVLSATTPYFFTATLLQLFTLLQPKTEKAINLISIDTLGLSLLFYDPYGNRTHDFTEKRLDYSYSFLLFANR